MLSSFSHFPTGDNRQLASMAFLRPLLLRSYGGFVAILAREGLDSDPPTPHHPMAIGGLSLYLHCKCPPPPHLTFSRACARARFRSSLCPSHAPAFGWGVTPMVAPRGLGGYASLISWSPSLGPARVTKAPLSVFLSPHGPAP
jgi:hypothetical protein